MALKLPGARCLTTMPTDQWLGPSWLVADPEAHLRQALREHGGKLLSDQLFDVYVKKPWLKASVGSLRECVSASSAFTYHARTDSELAYITLLRAECAPEPREGGACTCVAKSFPKCTTSAAIYFPEMVWYWMIGDGRFYMGSRKAGFYPSKFDGFTGGSIKLFDARGNCFFGCFSGESIVEY